MRPKNRCYLVYARAPKAANVRNSNHLFNDCISDTRRGLCVFHDHFVRRPGGIAIFDVRSEDEAKMLDEAGPLEEWDSRFMVWTTPSRQSVSSRR
jgi:hypothetical protein